MPTLRSLAGLAVLALVAAACGGGGDAADTTTTTSTSTTTTTVARTTTTSSTTTTTTEPPPPIRQPLTGQVLESEDDVLPRPALVAKIDNNRRAVPNHSGLAVADIVFEEMVEGRTTRFAAVFHSQSSNPLGPIRSGRTQDVDLFTSFGTPLFVWSGGNPNVTRAINESVLVNLGPNNASGYYRGPGGSPHNLYTDTDTMWFQTPPDALDPPPQQFEYLADDDEVDGKPTGGVDVMVGGERIEWFWNPEIGRFDRQQRGRLHVDAVHGQISATNVIVMGVAYQPSVADRRSPEAQTVGEGLVWVFTDGQLREGLWQREVNTEPIRFVTAEGDPILLAPGNTWIELADNADLFAGRITLLPPP